MCEACIGWVDGSWSGCDLSTGTGIQEESYQAVNCTPYTRNTDSITLRRPNCRRNGEEKNQCLKTACSVSGRDWRNGGSVQYARKV